MESPPLDSGCLKTIFINKDMKQVPVLQVLDVKEIPSNKPGESRRYRLCLSDGVHYAQAMLPQQLTGLITDGHLQCHMTVRMKEYLLQDIKSKRIIIALNLEIVGSDVTEKIGEPVNVETVNRAEPPAPATVTPVRNGPAFRGGPATAWNAQPAQKTADISPTGVIPPARGNAGGKYRDIQSLNPYQGRWAVKGRCTFKSDVRTFTNARGEGKLMSFELTDNSGSIRVTCFTDLVDSTNAMVHVGRVFVVSKGQLKPANEKYNRSTSNFEMTLGRESELREDSDDGSVAQIKYNFTKIAQLETIEVKGACDVVAVVHEIQPLSEITMRSTGDQVTKRSLTLVDDSGATVEMTLWRNAAETLVTEADIDRHPVIVLRGASRGDFGGVCLNISRATTIELDPTTIPEGNALRGWYDAGGAQAENIQSMSGGRMGSSNKVLGDRKSLGEGDEEDVQPGLQGGPVSFATRGYVTFMKKDRDLSYPSDPETKKKLTETGAPGMWHSESTGREFTDDQVQHRYICSMKVSDWSDSKWLTAFDEAGMVILGRSAGEMRTLRSDDIDMYESIIDDCLFRPFVIKVQARLDEWNGEARTKYVMQRVEPVEFVSESHALLSEIKAYGI